MQTNVWQYYQTNRPGQVQVIGVDMYDGTNAQVQTFMDNTGATYPLLRLGVGYGTNLTPLYGPYDNHVIINKQGIVRLDTYPSHPHGARFILSEIRACIDSLTTNPVDVDGAPRAARASLRAAPNPFRTSTAVDLTVPVAGTVRVSVFDLSGREVARLWDGHAGAGPLRLDWDGQTGVAPARQGVYLVRADLASVHVTARVVRLR